MTIRVLEQREFVCLKSGYKQLLCRTLQLKRLRNSSEGERALSDLKFCIISWKLAQVYGVGGRERDGQRRRGVVLP